MKILQLHRDSESEAPVSSDRPIPPRERLLSRWGWLGVGIVVAWLAVAVLGPWIAPFGENDLPFPGDYSEFQAPRAGAPLGTDVMDRDILSRMIHAARRTIGISFAGTFLAYLMGVSLGIAAVVLGRRTDMILSRANDALLSIPTIMLGMILIVALGPSVAVLIATAAVVYMSIVFRLARALAAEIMVMDFVRVARVRGEGTLWIVFREILPNVTMPLISDFGLRLIYVVLFVSSMSFLGLGVQPPKSDWGSMVRENLAALQYGASVVPLLAPALAIASLTLAINLVVDDLSSRVGGRFKGRI